ncbi:hypothetical protein BC832DRAFT_308310 [Gaertneriomyces semiglobifer]|nr:hypothetical protein BC832DRAFT_308310 [Gaertneriomyces semiglobifer]
MVRKRKRPGLVNSPSGTRGHSSCQRDALRTAFALNNTRGSRTYIRTHIKQNVSPSHHRIPRPLLPARQSGTFVWFWTTFILSMFLIAEVCAAPSPGSAVRVLFKPLFPDSSADELVYITPYLDEFTARTGIPVSVNVENVPETEDYLSVVSKHVIPGREQVDYDIIALEFNWLEQWKNSFHLLSPWRHDETGSLGDQISQRVTEQYADIVNHDAVDGDLIALPLWSDYGTLYVRSDLLAKHDIPIPTTLAEIGEVCAKILPLELPTHKSLQCFVAGFNSKDLTDFVSELFMTYEATPLIKFQHQPVFNTPGNALLLETLAEWVRLDYISQRTMSYEYNTALETWLSGEAVFFRGRHSAAARTRKRWGIMVPVNGAYNGAVGTSGRGYHILSGSNVQAQYPIKSVQGGYHLAVLKNGQYGNVTAVMEVLLWLTDRSVQRDRALHFGVAPTLENLHNDADVCRAIHCNVIDSLQWFSSASLASSGLWIEVEEEMRLWFKGIMNGAWPAAEGLALASDAVTRVFNNPPNKPWRPIGGEGLGTTGIVLLSVLIPFSVIAGMSAIFAYQRRRKRREAKKDMEELNVGERRTTSHRRWRDSSGFGRLVIRPARRRADRGNDAGTPPSTNLSSTRDEKNRNSTATVDIPPDHPAGSAGPPILLPQRNVENQNTTYQRYPVIHTYTPLLPDELPLTPGDIVTVRLAYDDGYAFGVIESRNRAGVFPLACLLPVGLEVGLPSRLESGPQNNNSERAAGFDWGEKVDSLEMLLLNGKITEATYLKLRREQEEEVRTMRMIQALRERLREDQEARERGLGEGARGVLPEDDRRRLRRRLDELELGVWDE